MITTTENTAEESQKARGAQEQLTYLGSGGNANWILAMRAAAVGQGGIYFGAADVETDFR